MPPPPSKPIAVHRVAQKQAELAEASQAAAAGHDGLLRLQPHAVVTRRHRQRHAARYCGRSQAPASRTGGTRRRQRRRGHQLRDQAPSRASSGDAGVRGRTRSRGVHRRAPMVVMIIPAVVRACSSETSRGSHGCRPGCRASRHRTDTAEIGPSRARDPAIGVPQDHAHACHVGVGTASEQMPPVLHQRTRAVLMSR